MHQIQNWNDLIIRKIAVEKFSVDRDIRIRHTFKYDICIYFVSLSTILHENSSSKLKTSYFSGLAYSKNERFDL